MASNRYIGNEEQGPVGIDADRFRSEADAAEQFGATFSETGESIGENAVGFDEGGGEYLTPDDIAFGHLKGDQSGEDADASPGIDGGDSPDAQSHPGKGKVSHAGQALDSALEAARDLTSGGSEDASDQVVNAGVNSAIAARQLYKRGKKVANSARRSRLRGAGSLASGLTDEALEGLGGAAGKEDGDAADNVVGSGARAARATKDVAGQFFSSGFRKFNSADDAGKSPKRGRRSSKRKSGSEAAKSRRMQQRTREATQARKATKQASKALSKASGGKGCGVIGCAPVAAVGILIIFLLLIVMVIGGVVGGDEDDDSDTGSLTGNESVIAQVLKNNGYDNTLVAAVLGNLKVESGCSPTAESSAGYYGIAQWSSSRRSKLQEYASSVGGDESDIEVQAQFLVEEMSGSYQYWSNSSLAKFKSYANTGNTDDPCEVFFSKFEVAGDSSLSKRQEYAREYYEQLTSSNGAAAPKGEEYASATSAQKAVVNAAESTASPGAGYCARWVSWVFRNAGYGSVSGNACDMYNNWCTFSGDDDIKVGMIIAVSKHSHTSAGKIYGHVAIYVGDGKVMHNVGSVETMDLDDWISYYGDTVEVRWGWANGKDLSAS